MTKKLLLILISGFLAITIYCQDRYLSLFYNDFSELNPAYVSFLDSKQATFNTDFEVDFSTGRAALNIPVSKIYSGFGIHATYSKVDIYSDLNFGIIYSFKYNITDKIKVSVGTNLSVFRHKIKGIMQVLHDDSRFYSYEQVDESVHLYNLDLGFWISFYGFQLGLSNKHINEPSGEMYLLDDTRMYRKNPSMNLVLNYDFLIAQKHTLSNSLLIYDLKDFSERKAFILSNQFKINNKFIIGLSTAIHKSKDISAYISISPKIGFNLSDKFDFVMSINLIQINTLLPKGNTMFSKWNTIEAVLNYNF
jgi:hypothetical protein